MENRIVHPQDARTRQKKENTSVERNIPQKQSITLTAADGVDQSLSSREESTSVLSTDHRQEKRSLQRGNHGRQIH